MEKDLLKMNLQYFAEDPDNGAEDENQENDDNDSTEDKNQPDETLPKTQSELDALINKANQTAIKNATKGLLTPEEAQKLVQDEIKKDKEYADLSEDERQQRELEDAKTEFEKEKEKFEREKLVSNIKVDLAERKLPVKVGEFDFAELFANTGDNEKAFEGVKSFEQAFKQAIAEERKNGFKQDEPGSGSGRNTNKSYGAKLGAKAGERNKKVFD